MTLSTQASAGNGCSRTGALLINLLAVLLLGVGLVRPATATVEVLAAPDLGFMAGGGTVRAIAR
jgi:hypothetical protein